MFSSSSFYKMKYSSSSSIHTAPLSAYMHVNTVTKQQQNLQTFQRLDFLDGLLCFWRVPLAILPRILAQSCVTPPYIIQTKGLRMIVLVSLIVLLRELLVSTIFPMVLYTSPFVHF